MASASAASNIGFKQLGPLPGPYCVVVVEEGSVAIVTAKLLEKMGQQVVMAETARRGIELVNETQADLVLTRIQLPDIDGFKFARAIRSGSGKQPVLVAHTGYGRSEIAAEAKRAGFDLILTK